ncbi:MAG: Flp pilus assembly protein CpaB [Bacillota bacterium]
MKGGKLVVLFALIPGLLAAVMTYVYINDAAKPKPVSGKSVPVVAAKSAIPPRTKITQDLVYIKEIPEAAVHARAARDPARVVGLITKSEILEGEQVIMDRLYGENERAGLASSIPRDKRAVTVPVNEVVGVAGFVKPGDRVDVVATVSAAGETGDVAFTVLEDVEVLAIAQETEDKSQGKAKVSTSATLAVTPAQAERLALAEEMGNLRLALRPLFASATKGSGIVAREMLREVKGWMPPRTPSSEAAPSPVVSVAPQAPLAPIAQAAASSQPFGPPGSEQMMVEVIKGSQKTHVALSGQGR